MSGGRRGDGSSSDGSSCCYGMIRSSWLLTFRVLVL